MPHLINGIGTYYYGKKNLQIRPGPCPHCGRAVELKSYDTRKWFVIFLFPIIPLGRLRIVDYCSVCTKHLAVAADQWETAKRTEVSSALVQYQAQPTVEAAVVVHQQLLNFHQLEQAAAFRKLMLEKYPHEVNLHVQLGAALERFGLMDEATVSYQRAHELQPDLPAARIGLACGHIRAGRLPEARALLAFLEEPGVAQGYSLAPLDQLVRAYQNTGQHEAALALLAIIQRELPQLNEQRWFRDLIYKSEQALKRGSSQVPNLPFSMKRLFAPGEASPARTGLIFAVILSLVLLGFVISNEFIRRHRTLHIVNRYHAVAFVQISGRAAPVKVHGLGEVALAEGTYRATISGPVAEEIEFTIQDTYWNRWFGKPVWVLNLGGAAILQLTYATYARDNPPPQSYHFSYGEKFRRFPHVTHVFEELPETIKLESGQQQTLTHLAVMSGSPADLFYYYVEEKNTPAALRFAEWQLHRQPEDDKLLVLYAQVASATEPQRIDDFLRPGLTNRPVLVQWHRLYQNLDRNDSRDAELAARYRAELEAEPTNSALMYLLGRVVPTRGESRQWFERACAADTNNAFAYFARAFDLMAVGEWAAARTFLDRACKLRPEQAEFVYQLERARFALGEFAELEKEARARLEIHPLDYSAGRRWCEALVAQQRVGEAITGAQKFQNNARAQAGERVTAANREFECYVHYLTGNFAALKQLTEGQTDATAKYNCFIAQIEAGEVLAAIKLLPAEENIANDPFHFLNTAIALRIANQPAEAARWFDLGLTALDQGDADWKRAAAWLRSTAPQFAAHDEIALAAESKITILTTQAQLHPELRAELLPLIARLNVLPGFPRHLIQTASVRLK